MCRTIARLILIATIMGTIGCDGVTKHLAQSTLAGQPTRSFLADTFRLEYSENTGGFLSVGSDWTAHVRTAVFSAGTGLLLAVFAIAAIRVQWSAAVCLASRSSSAAASPISWIVLHMAPLLTS